MIQIVMKPVPGQGVVNRESLYTALFNGEDIGMQVRALRASHAEQKVMEMLRHSIDKVGGRLLVDYNLEQWKERKNGSDTGTHEELREASESPEVAAPDEGVGEGGAVAPDGA
jgi:hypothetical protein